jgi:hypothetical protein
MSSAYQEVSTTGFKVSSGLPLENRPGSVGLRNDAGFSMYVYYISISFAVLILVARPTAHTRHYLLVSLVFSLSINV